MTTARVALIRFTKRRVVAFRSDVNDELWKAAHEDAMRCLAFEDVLAFGVGLYDSIILADEMLRETMVESKKFDAKAQRAMRRLFELWLEPCKLVENTIRGFERRGFKVKHSAEFRKRHAEAVWMLAPAGKAFDHGRMVELRDKAIEECRS